MTRQSIAGGRARPWWTIVTGVAAGLLGLGLLGLGAWLLLLGGSPYYAAAGLMLLAAGILIVLGRPAGIWLYAALLVGTVLWSLYEVGLDGWALIPRLVAPAVLGIWLFSPLVAGRLRVSRQSTVWPCYAAMAACAILIGLVFLAGYRITERRTIEAAAAPANTVAGIAAGTTTASLRKTGISTAAPRPATAIRRSTASRRKTSRISRRPGPSRPETCRRRARTATAANSASR